MGMHGGGMAEGAHMMGGGTGMMIFGLLHIVIIVLFFWLMYRGIVALETIAEKKDGQTGK